MNKKNVREIIFKYVFRIDFISGSDFILEIDSIFEDINIFDIKKEDKIYIKSKINNIYKNLKEIDKIIEKYIINWKFSRINKIDLTILRISIYEILFEKDIPIKISINEAVNLSKKYGTSKSYSFINGVLASFYKDISKKRETYNILDKIEYPKDLKKLTIEELKELSEEIRRFLINNISKTGGHLASNLGIVELVIVLHRNFDFLKDKLIFDTGHQSYVHKILTGRKKFFNKLRYLDNISGFPKTNESTYDSFNTGHCSTSLSVGLGFSYFFNNIKKSDNYVVCFIGDGSFGNGLVYEALNNISEKNKKLIIILNDNEMSINKNVGNITKYLSFIKKNNLYEKIKDSVNKSFQKIPYGDILANKLNQIKESVKRYLIPGSLFENFGIKYIGPIDGYDIENLEKVLKQIKTSNMPVLLHVCTKKGKGYLYSEKYPQNYHNVKSFDKETGKVISDNKRSFKDVFSNTINKISEDNSKIIAITASMTDCVGLKDFKNKFPDRFIDVGISEEHSVLFAAGLAINGLKPIVCLYSSFLQRSFDQILIDIATQKLNVTFIINKAGIVGYDGDTHQGLFDISMLLMIPNIVLMSPKDINEFESMIKFAINYNKGPIAIRYFDEQNVYQIKNKKENTEIKLGKGEVLCEGKDILIICFGSMVEIGDKVVELLKKDNYFCSLINLRFAKPLDKNLLLEASKDKKLIVTIEEGIINGGIGQNILKIYSDNNIQTHIINIGIEDTFVEHGNIEKIKEKYKLDEYSIRDEIINKYKFYNKKKY